MMIGPTTKLTAPLSSSPSFSCDNFISRRLFFLRDVQILELFLALFVFLAIHSLRQKKRYGLPVWPALGMLPSLFLGIQSNIYEWITDVLSCQNGTFRFKGPWFGGLNSVVTCDPRNIEYLLKTRFSIFPKGAFFHNTVHDLLGDGIFSVDYDMWQQQRKTASIEFHSAKFRQLTNDSLLELVHQRLLPVLETSAKNSTPIDLQEVLLRLTFDNICMIAFGVDPGCLRPDLPEIPFARAFEDATEATMLRFVTPTFIWKTMRSLDLGTERKLKESIKDVDDFAEEVIKTRKKELSLQTDDQDKNKQRSDLLTVFMGLKDEQGRPFSDKFLRDVCVNFILAGRDTSSVALSWFFWLLDKNPTVEEKILEEICKVLSERDEIRSEENPMERPVVFSPGEIKKMDYLQAALSEALRLYPSVPVDHKEIVEDDVFPDGTVLKKGERVIYAIYAMGRMEAVWGNDCHEFKPQRWLRAADGRYLSESAYKFTAFNGGPRLCLGKDFAYFQMKFAAAAIIFRYKISVLKDHRVAPKLALTMYMKHGLKVNLIQRDVSEIRKYFKIKG